MKITNTGSAPDRLVGGATEVAKRLEIHEMRMDGGVMRMRELANGLEIPPGATVELKPGSYHLMLQNLRAAHQGRARQGITDFEKAGKVDIELDVEAVGGAPRSTSIEHARVFARSAYRRGRSGSHGLARSGRADC